MYQVLSCFTLQTLFAHCSKLSCDVIYIQIAGVKELLRFTINMESHILKKPKEAGHLNI